MKIFCMFFLMGVFPGVLWASERPLEAIRKERKALERETSRSAEARKAELLFWEAHYTEDEKQKDALLEEGMAIIEQELLDNPKSAALLYWWIAFEGERVQRGSKLKALKGISTLEKKAKELWALDPSWGAGAADRILGHLYHVAPWGVSIGSKEKARTHLKAAYERDPKHPVNRLYWGRFLAEEGEKDSARGLLKNLWDGVSPQAYALERASWEKLAREVLSKMDAAR